MNRKDAEGNNVFQGGFLGLDNIGVFDRSRRRCRPAATSSSPTAPAGWRCTASTCWRSRWSWRSENPAYEDVASKFWEHFLYIAHAMSHHGQGERLDLWDDEDGFFYDVLHLPDGTRMPLKVRSMVGLIPLFAVETLEPEMLERLPGLPAAPRLVRRAPARSHRQRRLHADAGRRRAPAALGRRRAIGCSACSRACSTSASSCRRTASARCRACTRDAAVPAAGRRPRPPRRLRAGANRRPACSAATRTGAGRSGSRSTTCSIEALQKFHHYFGDDFTVECPTGSGQHADAGRGRRPSCRGGCRASSCATRTGRRPVFGGVERFQSDPHWRDHVPFHEYFHGDNGARPRRQPPDRLDGARRQAAAAERRRRGRPGGDRGRAPTSVAECEPERPACGPTRRVPPRHRSIRDRRSASDVPRFRRFPARLRRG